MLCLLVYCSVGATPQSHLEQRLAREADAAAGRNMCRTTGGCALRVTNVRKQQIRRACMAECDPSHKANTTGRLPPPVPPLRPPPTSEGALATDPRTVLPPVPLPSGQPGAQVVQGTARVVPTARATEATVATPRVDGFGAAVRAWMKAAALVAVGVVATVAVSTRVAQRAALPSIISLANRRHQIHRGRICGERSLGRKSPKCHQGSRCIWRLTLAGRARCLSRTRRTQHVQRAHGCKRTLAHSFARPRAVPVTCHRDG